jgi:pimeloyl-ACP methyl ester carboxylesterase
MTSTHYHPAKVQKFSPTVVFVHHMWGSHKTTRRHQLLVNELGYNCISFDLLFGSQIKTIFPSPLILSAYKGIFHLWMRQIHGVLDQISGEKILYSFSGPCLSSLWAASERQDIKKVICDGGPFEQIYSNTKNFFIHEMGIKQPALNSLAAFAGTALWGLSPLDKLHRALEIWPHDRPILSVRGKLDPIVAIDSIDAVFRQHPHLNLKLLEIEQGQHLDGLKRFPKVYKPAISDFLAP